MSELTAAASVVPSASSEFVDGARAIIPMVVGVVPFGLAIGAVAADADIPTWAGWSGALLLLGGSAQLAIIRLLDEGAAGPVAVLAALLINARLLVYGAGLAGWFPTTSVRRRLLLAAPLVDQLYLRTTTDFQAVARDERARRWFYAGASVHLWSAWVVAQTLGVLVGRGVPVWLGLEASSPIALSGLLAAAVTGRGAARAAVTAGALMVLTAPFGTPSLMVVAVLVGVTVGLTARSGEAHPA